MKKFLAGFGWALSVIFAVAVFAAQTEPGTEINSQAAAERLSRIIQFKTTSYQDAAKFEGKEFFALQSYLEKSYPLVRQKLKKEIVADYSLLYQWRGTDSSLAPIMLMAHQDVVPAGAESEWKNPPFSGKLVDGYIWGRGTMDDKGSLVAILEAVEDLLGKGFQPRRTIYISMSHDEEVGGMGTIAIAELLQSRGVRLDLVLDEGGAVSAGVMPGVKNSVALIGTAEKGYLSVELLVETEGGHSSAPPRHSAIGILATAIHNLERKPFPPRIAGVTEQTFAAIAPQMSPEMKMIFQNRWLFGPMILKELENIPQTDAAIRTTIATTIISAGDKENILPRKASAIVNLRLLPGDTIGPVIKHIERAIDDPQVKVRVSGHHREASKASSPDSNGFKLISSGIKQIYPDAVVAPYLVLGGTDSRHYQELSENIFRFSPFLFGPEDLKLAHNINERISVENLERAIKFYIQFLRNSDSI